MDLLLKLKSEAFFTIKEWKILIENQTGKKVKRLSKDNGLEFCSNEFNVFCKKALLDISQFQAVVERLNITILERVRFMLSHSGLVKEFWAEVASTTCYLINCSPNRALDGCIPEEVRSGNPVDYSNLEYLSVLFNHM